MFEHRYRKCVGTRRRVQCIVQKRLNRNLRLSEFGINDVLLRKTFWVASYDFPAIDRGVRLLHFARSTGWRVWEALTEKERQKLRLASESAILFKRK